MLCGLEAANARSRLFDFGSLFAFPQTRVGRANGRIPMSSQKPGNDFSGSISVSKNGGAEADIIQKLISSVMQEAFGRSTNLDDIPFHNKVEQQIPVQVEGQPPIPLRPRNVDQMSDFGSRLGEQETVMSLTGDLDNPRTPPRRAFVRQNGGETTEAPAPADDDEIRCIPKVMQVEETVYDRAIKCHHSYQEKCHMTYITDYRSTTEEKCETSFKKNCHITFKPTPFNESVRVCYNPLVRTCSNQTQGPDICNTYYETNCETTYKTYEIEQDEPVCVMELMQKCEDVNIQVPEAFRAARQDDEDTSSADATEGGEGGSNTVTVDQRCEQWPVQKCTLEKKTVKKVHPDTACRKIPREVCVPNNCAMVAADEVCRDENRMQVQNVPQEECELQPEETCHMEAVLVPRLVPKPNCVKVPKEICVNTKKNPRRVKKPVVKEWCYRPSDLKHTPEVQVPSGDPVFFF